MSDLRAGLAPDAVLIIGVSPPLIGGITIHVKRLREILTRNQIPHLFFDYRKERLSSLLPMIRKCKFVHLHAFSPYFKVTVLFLCKALRKPIVVTFHENIDNKKSLGSFINRIVLKNASLSIVINEQSLLCSRKITDKTVRIPAYIEPEAPGEDGKISLLVKSQKNSGRKVFCTNASDVGFRPGGFEVYGIINLVEIFSALKEYSLIISDPSGNYAPFIQKKYGQLPPNIGVLSFQHDFTRVIQESDAVLRATCTDGDSLTVKEALFFRKPVIASDVVDRPEGTIVYKYGDNSDLTEKIIHYTDYQRPVTVKIESGGEKIVQLYREQL